MNEVLYFSENPELADELASAGARLAKETGGEVFSLELDDVRPSIKAGGNILLIKSETKLSGNPELTASAISRLAQQRRPSVLLLGTSRLGRQIGARLAVRLRMGSLADVSGLEIKGGKLYGERSVYAGKFQARVASSLPSLALVRPGAYVGREGPVESVREVSIGPLEMQVSRLESRPKQRSSVDLKSASVIVAAGRGVKRKEDLELVERLAKILGGVVGGSRPLSSDLGWLGEERHIGLTGIYVHPDLYIAIGISGQLQHVAGIKESKLIVAINRDRQAPIFQVADYGIVGDLYTVVPALLRILERRTAR